MKIEELARMDNADGFTVFYNLVHKNPLPKHAMEWVEAFYKAKDAERGLIVKAFRGSTKSTTFATICAHQLGIHPDGSVIVVRGSDASAEETDGMVAKMIEDNPGWQLVFPWVVKDEKRGWSVNGREVWDNRVPYEVWIRQVSGRFDPSFMSKTYTSEAFPGPHPSLLLLIDDIHNENNTTSERELVRVKKLLSGTIMPMRTVHYPPTVLIGTPWVKNDAMAAYEASGEWDLVATPAILKDGTLVWPEVFTQERLDAEKRQDITGGAEFARMFLLDLEAGSQRVFSYQTYPANSINFLWPAYGGCDFASMEDPTKRITHRSHYALAYLMERPEGGAVVYDGVLEQWTQSEGEQAILSAQSLFPAWQHTIVEGDGKGEAFIAVLSRNPGARIVAMNTGGRQKAKRLTDEMGPWLRVGRLKISDAETKFLSALRRFLNEYPNVTRDDPGWDAADAVYWALHAMPHVLVMPAYEKELPSLLPRPRAPNPWNMKELSL